MLAFARCAIDPELVSIRTFAAASCVVLLSVSGCADDYGFPTDASAEKFCTYWQTMPPAARSDEPTPADAAALVDEARTLGLPDSSPDAAREGLRQRLEFLVAVAANEDATAIDLRDRYEGTTEWAAFEDFVLDRCRVDAFHEYTG